MVVGVTALAALATAALAQSSRSPLDPLPLDKNQRAVSLVAQDSSDCTNTTVKDDPTRTRGGQILVTRGDDGKTKVHVTMTVTPSMTYHFYLKCIGPLGDITTDEEGIGTGDFSFATSSAGSVFAFDMYPEGAPSGNKFQSLTVSFK
jgi:hypothetical protein